MRLLMTDAKKAYASVMGIQEGNVIPKNEQLDIKGIASMAKSSMSDTTRKELKKILLEEILTAPTIDQFRIIEKLAILERKIINSIMEGSREFYKPVTIKAQSSYENPMRIQGVKASVVWNSLKSSDLPGIDLDERNAIDVAKIILNTKTVDKLAKYPEVYENAKRLLADPIFGGKVDSIAIPLDTDTPEWVLDMIDYKLILNNNISGFVYDSVGLVNLDPNTNNTNYSNILQF